MKTIFIERIVVSVKYMVVCKTWLNIFILILKNKNWTHLYMQIIPLTYENILKNICIFSKLK